MIEKLSKPEAQIKGIKVIQKKFWSLRVDSFEKGICSINKNLSKSERYVAGLILYWAEGTKRKNFAITNSDPRIIKFMSNWLNEFFLIPPSSLTIQLNIHSGQNETEIINFWSKLTGIPSKNFYKSFVKPEGKGFKKNILYHGTAKLRIRGHGSTYTLFEILGALAGFLRSVIDEKPKIENWIERPKYS